MKFPYEEELFWNGPEPSFWSMDHDQDFRIIAAIGFTQATLRNLSKRYQAAWPEAITEMEVRKGTLQIRWRDHDARVMFEGVIAGAWENATNEFMVEHFLPGGGHIG